MQIVKIKKLKKYFLVIFNDSEITLRSINTISFFKLRPELELTNEEIDEILRYDLQEYFYNRSINLISIRPRSFKEIDEYLNRKLFEFNIKSFQKERVLSKLVEQNYLNDESFTKWFVDQRVRNSNKGPEYIKRELILKGIDFEIINSELSKFSPTDFENQLTNLIEKKYRIVKGKNEYEKKQKVIQFLVRKGYDLDIIKRFIDI